MTKTEGFEIWQVDPRDEQAAKVMYLGLESLEKMGEKVQADRYKLVHSEKHSAFVWDEDMGDEEAAEWVYHRFNDDMSWQKLPSGYQGRSTAVGDVIVLDRGGKRGAWFVDPIGCEKIDGLAEKLKGEKQ